MEDIWEREIKMSALLLVFLICFSNMSYAETIKLKSGITVEGKIIELTDDYVVIEKANKDSYRFNLNKISSKSLDVLKTLPKVTRTKEELAAAAGKPRYSYDPLLKETEESEPTKEQLEKVDKDGENIELGIKAYNDQNYEEAIGYLSKVPDRWISHMVLGQIYSILEQYDKALFHSSKAIEIDPRPYNPYFHKGMVYYGLKDYKNAISCLEEARARGIKKTQDEALTDLFLGHSYGYLMNLEKSKENYKLALPLFYKLNDSKNISKIEKQLKDMEEYMESKN